jgi:hypothetical protein
MSGALLIAIKALVFAGLPVINTLTSSAAWSFRAWPCGLKIGPVGLQQVARAPSPCCAAGADQARQVDPVEDLIGVVADLHAG